MSTTAIQLDLSRLPAPDVVQVVDTEALLAARLVTLGARFAAINIPWNASPLNPDSAVALQQEDTDRQAKTLDRINHAARQNMLAYTAGSNLDHKAALFNVVRMPGESDSRLRRRVQLALEASGTNGRKGGFEFRALSADIRLADVLAYNYASGQCAPGEVLVVALPQAGLKPEEELEAVSAARRALIEENSVSFTDTVIVSKAVRKGVNREAVLTIGRGPDPIVVKAQAEATWRAYLAEVRTIGTQLSDAGEKAALKVGGVDHVQLLGDPENVPVAYNEFVEIDAFGVRQVAS